MASFRSLVATSATLLASAVLLFVAFVGRSQPDQVLLAGNTLFHQSHDSQLADLIDSPLLLAKERIDHMMSLDDPGVVNPIHLPKDSSNKKVDCMSLANKQSLACGPTGWENDYAQESERRFKENEASMGLENTKQSMATVVSELQAKLAEMKQKFRMIRSRYTSGPQKQMSIRVFPRGPRGVDGPEGVVGPAGRQGPQGDTGPTGPRGYPGPQGNIGPTGVRGDKGFRGNEGLSGAPGIQGFVGAIGDTGPTGPQGSRGLPGATGSPGANGVDGIPGPSGLDSTAGPTGLEGLPGPRGDSGTPGIPGTQGPQGFQGKAGDPGVVGAPGSQGTPGLDGVGPAPAIALLKSGDWPDGNCFTRSTTCTDLGVADNLCGECKPLCPRCDADVGFTLTNPYGLRFDGATFDSTRLGAGSAQVRNICLLARYGNKGLGEVIPTALSYGSASTISDRTRVHWNGNCGDSQKFNGCCDNSGLMPAGTNWNSLALGNSCSNNGHLSPVTVEINCIFDDSYYNDASQNKAIVPDPDPIDYLDSSDYLVSDEMPYASKLVSDDNACQLTFGDTGNLAVTKVGSPKDKYWETSTAGQGTAPFKLSINQGSLLLSDSKGNPTWSSSTPSSGANRLVLFEGCNLCLVKNFVGKGQWSRGLGRPLGSTSASDCKGASYGSCLANSKCSFVRKWGCYPSPSSSGGTLPWCRNFGRPRESCKSMDKCVYSDTKGCFAQYGKKPLTNQLSTLPSGSSSSLKVVGERSASREILSMFDDILSNDDLDDVLSEPDYLSSQANTDGGGLHFPSHKRASVNMLNLQDAPLQRFTQLGGGQASDYIWCSSGSLTPAAPAPAPPAVVSAPPSAPAASVSAPASAPAASVAAPPPAPVAKPAVCDAVQKKNGLCNNDGKSILNSFCKKFRDDRETLSAVRQQQTLAKCMAQDCEQSLEGALSKGANYCRFLDSNGLCYAYDTAQVWCSQNTDDGMCNSGGIDWATKPVGSADSVASTKWAPRQNVELVGKGAGTLAGSRYSCSCFKNCACTNIEDCVCTTDADKKAIGAGTGFKAVVFKPNLSHKGDCACECGGYYGK